MSRLLRARSFYMDYVVVMNVSECYDGVVEGVGAAEGPVEEDVDNSVVMKQEARGPKRRPSCLHEYDSSDGTLKSCS